MQNKKILLIIGGVGCGLLLLCTICFIAIFGATKFLTKDASATANQFFTYIKEGKIDESYDMTSDAFKQETSKSDWSSFIDQYELDRNNGVNWTTTEVKNNSATLEGKIKLPDGERGVRMELEKSGSTWKVYGMKLL
jgi:hypothetical protein